MKKTIFVTPLVLFALIAACSPLTPKLTKGIKARNTKADSTQEKTSNQELESEAKATETCNTKNDQSLSEEKVIQSKQVIIEKIRQRVVRRDCNQKIISDKVEIIQEQQKSVRIAPKQIPLAKQIDRSSAYNRTSCEEVKQTPRNKINSIIENLFSLEPNSIKQNQILFNIDIAGSDKVTTVAKGENFIDYSFDTCAQLDSAKNCLKYTSLEQGTLVLTVKVDDQELGGVKEIIDCKPSVDSNSLDSVGEKLRGKYL